MKRVFRFPASSKSQTGLSLIELMIALLLGTILTVGLVQVFTSNSQSFRNNESSARTLESGRIAADILSRAIRNAGFFGCYPVEAITNNLNPANAVLHGFATYGVSARASERPVAATIPNTDFFNVTGVRRPGAIVKLAADLTDTTDIRLNDAGRFGENDLIYITNCERGDIFQIADDPVVAGTEFRITADNDGTAPGNNLSSSSALGLCTTPNACLSSVYARGTEIFQPYSEAYFIGAAAGPGNTRSLFMRQADGTDIELVSGVEDMKVQFGEGTVDAGVQNWRDATAVSTWENVQAIEISLLVAGPNANVMASAQKVCFPGWEDCVADPTKLVTVADNRLHRVYTFTGALRNSF
jgi:type IV pilus assembly protein PilW